MNKYLIISLVSALLLSCGSSSLNREKYIRYIENPENGLMVKKNIGDYQFSLLYKPTEYIILKSKDSLLTTQGMETEKQKYKGMQYYTFRIMQNKTGEEESSVENNPVLTDYLDNYAENDFLLICGKDTLPCLLYHFERSYNAAPYQNILLGFAETKDQSLTRTLVFNDKALGTGIVKMSVSNQSIQNIPALDLN